jgi:hypothetical protein
MPDADLMKSLTDAAYRLISATTSGEVDGVDVAREIGRDPEDPNAELHHAFWNINRRGDLECDGWRGGMGLPYRVRLPPGR